MGYHVDDIRIIRTYRKHLLILLDVLLMDYILREVGMEIVKPEYVYVIYRYQVMLIGLLGGGLERDIWRS